MVATTLDVGDIAVIGVSTEDTIPGGSTANDSISFMLLQPIGSGTQVFFTDRAWNGSNLAAASGGEGTFTYTAATDLPAGTVVTITQAQLTAAGISLADAGETIYVYQGTINAPTRFLHAVDIADGTAGFDGAELTNTGLVSGVSAVAIADDNAEFGTRTSNIQPNDLFTQINSSLDWVHNDNSPQDGTASDTPAFTAPDRQIWVAGSGAGEAIVTINLDGTYNSGTLGYQIVQAFQNDASLFHPSDITLDTVHDKFFFVDADLAGHNRIVQGSISQLLNNPGAALSLTVLYSNPDSGATNSMRTLSVDPTSQQIYFDLGTTFAKINYNTAGQTPTVLANLGSGNFVTQVTIDYAHGEVYLGSSHITSVFGQDVVDKNYIYKATGLTSGSSSLTFSQLPFNPDDDDAGAPNDPDIGPMPGEAWPAERGTIRGVDVDPTGHFLYIVTGTVILDTSPAQDGSQLTTFFGGVYRYALDGNPNGDVTTLYQQNGSTGPVGLLYYIEVDPVSGRYYVIDATGTNGDPGDGGVWSGSLTAPGTPTFVATVGNFNGLGPQGLEIQSAPTLTGTALAPTITETAGNPSPNPTAVQVANNFQSTDADSGNDPNGDQLAGAQVRISGNFQSGSGHQDQLTINGTTSGSLTFGADTVNYSYNASSGVMTLTGITTLDNYEAALALVRYRVDGDNPTNFGTAGTRTISFSTFDGLLYSDEVHANVTVVGVNDAPVNDATPTSASGPEDAAAIAITGLAVSDVDADPASQDIRLTLSVTNGTLDIRTDIAGGIIPGDITGGADGSATITITATQDQINATLGNATGLQFTPTANFNGTAQLTMTTEDLGATGTGGGQQDSDIVNITVTAVNDPVTSSAPATLTLAEDAGLTPIAGLSIADIDAALTPGGIYSVTLSSTHGTLSLAAVIGLSFTGGGNGTATMTFTGTLAAINAALATAGYAPDANYNGADSINISVTDSVGGIVATGSGAPTSDSDTINVTVTAVSDPVSTNAPPTLTLAEDAGATPIAGLSIADVDAALAPAGVYEVTLTSTNGTLTLAVLAGLTFTAGDGTTDATMTFHGTLASINAALATAAYTPAANYNGPASITFSATDQFGGIVATGTGLASTDSDTINVTVTAVNDAPTVDLNGAGGGTGVTLGYTENGAATAIAPAATVTDIDSTDLNGGSLTVHFSANGAAEDQLSILTGGGITLNGSNVEFGGQVIGTFTGGANGSDLVISFNSSFATPAAVAALVEHIGYADNSDNPSALPRTLTFTVDDGDGGTSTGVATATINITAQNDAPTATIIAPSFAGQPNVVLDLKNHGLSVGDVDGGPPGVETVTLSVDHGALTVTAGTSGAAVLNSGTAAVTITGTIAQINALLNTDGGSTVSFLDAAPVGPVTLTLNINDNGNSGPGGSQTAQDTAQILLGDAPIVSGAGSTVAYTEQSASVVIDSTLTITDTDSTVINGATVSILPGFVAGDQLNFVNQNGITGAYLAGVLTLTGTATLAQYEAALESITFSSTSDNPTNSGLNASRTVTWTVQDHLNIPSSPVTSTVTVTGTDDPHTGGVAISGTTTENQVLTAVSTLADPDGLGTLHYDWQRDTGSGFVSTGAADQSTYTLGDADVGGTVRVVVSYTDGGGTAETETSGPTAAIAGVNDPHTGGASITGTATEDQTLTAVSTLADVDGLGLLHYDWQHDVGGGFVSIGAADQATYTLGDGDVGGLVRVVVSYTDGQGFAESATSASTAAITNVNDAPTGNVAVTGTTTENQVLTADTATLADLDGLGTLHYQWQRDIGGGGFVNVGVDQTTYTLGDADVGGTIRVVVAYTDGHGTAESVTSGPTGTVAAVNDPHTGGASISGTATEDQVLTAVSTLADVDGLGALHYDWQRNTGSGFVSTGAADQSTYTLGDADVGGLVRVVVSYTDGQGFAESATSAATAAVLNINDAPTGGVAVAGTVAEHQVLTADTSTLVDADGLGTLHYQWQRDLGGGFVNVGLDQVTYTLNAVDIGGNMRVVTSYTDGHGTAESVTSPQAGPVIDTPDPATVALSNLHAPIFENASTAVHIKMADITITDADGGANVLSLSGVDAGLFEIVGTELFLRAGAVLDYETNPVLNVNVDVDDVGVPGTPDGTAGFALNILDIVENKIGTPGKDILVGTNNGETLSGLGGNDRIIGLGGNDRIVGGLGVDVMTGGPGNDVFVFNSIYDSAPGQSGLVNANSYGAAAGQGKRDLITDFTHGQDKLDLSAMDSNVKVAGNQAFAWRGTGNFTHSPGQLIERLYNPAGTAFDKTIIYGDVNGDMRADFQIELTGLKTITVSDFIL